MAQTTYFEAFKGHKGLRESDGYWVTQLDHDFHGAMWPVF